MPRTTGTGDLALSTEAKSMVNLKTAISLPESLFEKVELLAKEMRIPRSQVFVLAVEDFVRRRESQQLLTKINEAYQDPPDTTERKPLKEMRGHHRKIVAGEW